MRSTKGEYVLLDPEEIEKVKLESRKTLELTQFVDLDDIDPIYYDKPYYRRPGRRPRRGSVRRPARGAASRPKKVGIGQLAMRGQEYVVSLKPCGRGMVLETLRYADEVNKAASYFRDIGDAKPDPDLLDLAETLIEKKAGDFDAERIPQPLCRRAEEADRGEAEEEGQARHPGRRAATSRPRARTSST